MASTRCILVDARDFADAPDAPVYADSTTFGFAAKRAYGDFAVYNLYNCTTNAKPLTLDFAAAGLPVGVPCAVFDFWSNRVLSIATNAYTTAPLDYHASALLRFTPLAGDGPTLVGSLPSQ